MILEGRRASALAFAHEGAEHLYLLDFVGESLPNLKETIETAYPDVKVCLTPSSRVYLSRLLSEATTVQGDAADESTIADLCQRAVREEGRLDVFFANVVLSFHLPSVFAH